MAPANYLAFTNYNGANGYFIFGQRQFCLPYGLIHKKIIGRNGWLIAKIYIPHYISLLPFGTGLLIYAQKISPFSSAKPVTKNCDMKFAICFSGKFNTPTICRPIRSSFV